MDEARTFIEEELTSSLQDPKVIDAIAGKLRATLGEDRGKEFVKNISVEILKMAKNKKTGKIDVRKLKTIKDDLDDFISKGKKNDSTEWAAADGIPRFLAEAVEDEDFCEIGGIEGFRALLKKFITPAICDVLTAISTGIEAGGSIINTIFELTNFWDGDDGPFSKLLEGLVEIFQLGAAVFLFGSQGLSVSDTIDQLPSRGRVLPIRETSDNPPKVFMASGCDSNFEGELVFYGQIEGVIIDTLKSLSESLGQWLNAPVEIVKWLLERLFGMFSHMDGVCSYLDAYVQLALVEGTFENSRFILQETACRPVDKPKLGHGCDGIDNNCDFVRDDCSEDQFPPTIDAKLAVDTCSALGTIFPDIATAQACVEKRVSAQDDCLPVNLSYHSTDGTDACNAIIHVTATATGCETERNTEQYDVSKTTVPVRFDGVAPTVMCSFDPGTDVLERFVTREGKTMILRSTNDELKDSVFSMDITVNFLTSVLATLRSEWLTFWFLLFAESGKL
jgi:hypothetical protein